MAETQRFDGEVAVVTGAGRGMWPYARPRARAARRQGGRQRRPGRPREIGLFRTIALEGEKYGIKANLLIFAFENMRLLYGR